MELTKKDESIQQKNIKKLVLRLLFVLIISIFITEFGIMVLLHRFLPPLSNLTASFLDSALLVIILFPILYLLVFNNMVRQIASRKEAEVDRQRVLDQLELLVDERTKDLKKKINELEKWQRLTTGREVKMKQLKEEIQNLKKKLNEK